MWSIRWSEFDKKWQSTVRQRDFTSEAARTKFIEKVTQKDSFHQIVSYSDPFPRPTQEAKS